MAGAPYLTHSFRASTPLLHDGGGAPELCGRRPVYTGRPASAEQETRSKLTAPWDWVYARSRDRLTSEDVSRLMAVKAPRFYTVESTLVINAQAPTPCPHCLCSLWSDKEDDPSTEHEM